MHPLTRKTMNIVAYLMSLVLCITQASGCLLGDFEKVQEAQSKAATFELPPEWKKPEGSETKRLFTWSSIIPIPGDENNLEPRSAVSKFMMVEFKGVIDDIYPGATLKEKAENFHQKMVEECRPEAYSCTVEPLRELTHASIKAYAITDNNNEGTAFNYWATTVFFEKDQVVFRLGIREKFEAPITQKTINKVLETIKVTR